MLVFLMPAEVLAVDQRLLNASPPVLDAPPAGFEAVVLLKDGVEDGMEGLIGPVPAMGVGWIWTEV